VTSRHSLLRAVSRWQVVARSIDDVIGSGVYLLPANADEAFQFAVDHGVVPVVGAGNDGREMPDHDRRPATRTPGTITVGALEADSSARGSSNYGSSSRSGRRGPSM
jgi:hypothetical protein